MNTLVGRAVVFVAFAMLSTVVYAQDNRLIFQDIEIIEFDKQGFHPPNNESFRLNCPDSFTAIGLSYQSVGSKAAQFSLVSSYNTGANRGRQWGIRFFNPQDDAVRVELQVICLRAP